MGNFSLNVHHTRGRVILASLFFIVKQWGMACQFWTRHLIVDMWNRRTIRDSFLKENYLWKWTSTKYNVQYEYSKNVGGTGRDAKECGIWKLRWCFGVTGLVTDWSGRNDATFAPLAATTSLLLYPHAMVCADNGQEVLYFNNVVQRYVPVEYRSYVRF
jgi:hypothetical protein